LPGTAVLELRVVEEGASDSRLDALSGKLRTAVLSAGAMSAKPLPATAPDGGKADLGFVLGALVVSLQPEAVRAVVDAVRQWLSGRSGRKVVITLDGNSIEVTGVSSDDHRRLIDAFLSRHSGKAR
jgi:Effector Associated Constant Component 1